MHKLKLAGAACVLALASCAPRVIPPEPAPAPRPAPPRPAPAPPTPPPLEWVDAPLSAGDWSYRDDGGSASALFGGAQGPSLVLRCDGGRIGLMRIGVAAGNSIAVRTTYGVRALPATPQSGGLGASLSAGDPLLDQMAFSRGRLAVEVPGAPLLIVPAWPEVARVVEECRGG